MLDRIGIVVSDLARSRTFYEAALAPLGCKVVRAFGDDGFGQATQVGFGVERATFWIGIGGTKTGHLHVAFDAGTRAAVDAFHQAALAAGAHENGPPGLRPQYHPDYYSALVFDPDGINLEAICHAPE